MCFVMSESYARNKSKDALKLKHSSMELVAHYVNDEPLRCCLVDSGYILGLLSLYRVPDKLMENIDIGIKLKCYREGYSLIEFDVDSKFWMISDT